MYKKIIIIMTLIVSMVFGSSVGINARAISNVFKWDGLLYISNQDIEKNEIYVDTGADVNNNPTCKNITRKSIRSDSVKELNAGNFKNVCIDGDLINNTNVKEKVLEFYQNGATIIIKKLYIKMKDMYTYFGIKYDNSEEFANGIDSSVNDKLKVVGISIYKDSSGIIHTTVISAEEFNKNDSIDKAVAYSILVKPQTTSNLIPKDTSNQIVSFNKGAVYASDPGWAISASNSWVDYWASVTIRYTSFLEKYPNNPDSQGKYYFLEYSPMTLTPQINPSTGLYFGIGTMHFSKDGQGATVVDLGPKPQPDTATLSVSIGGPPLACSFSFPVGCTVSTSLTNGIGSTISTWNFTPKVLLAACPTTSQISFELVNEYKKSASSFKICNSYNIEMCSKLTPGGFWYSYTTVYSNGRYVSGN